MQLYNFPNEALCWWKKHDNTSSRSQDLRPDRHKHNTSIIIIITSCKPIHQQVDELSPYEPVYGAGERSVATQLDKHTVSQTFQFSWQTMGEATFQQSIKHAQLWCEGCGLYKHTVTKFKYHFLLHYTFSSLVRQFVQLHRPSSLWHCKKHGNIMTSHA